MVLEEMSSAGSRMFSDQEWKEVHEGWAANLGATIELPSLGAWARPG